MTGWTRPMTSAERELMYRSRQASRALDAVILLRQRTGSDGAFLAELCRRYPDVVFDTLKAIEERS